MNSLRTKINWTLASLFLTSGLVNCALALRHFVAYEAIVSMSSVLSSDLKAVALLQSGPQMAAETRSLVAELAAYSQTEPEMLKILSDHGVKINMIPPASK